MSDERTTPGREPRCIGPYLAVVAVALVLAVALAIYVASYRGEILAILTQSPT